MFSDLLRNVEGLISQVKRCFSVVFPIVTQEVAAYSVPMRPVPARFTSLALLAAALVSGWHPSLRAAEPTAFDLVKEGNRYVGEQAKDKVVQIRSDKSIGGLQPAIWYVVYYDPTATFKSVEVKFCSGKMLDVKRPLRMVEPVTGGDKQLPKEKLKIDSDKAIKIATGEPILEKLTLKATQLKLERWEDQPVWKVRIWAAKLQNPNQHAELGEVILSAEDGKVMKNDLKINRVD